MEGSCDCRGKANGVSTSEERAMHQNGNLVKLAIANVEQTVDEGDLKLPFPRDLSRYHFALGGLTMSGISTAPMRSEVRSWTAVIQSPVSAEIVFTMSQRPL